MAKCLHLTWTSITLNVFWHFIANSPGICGVYKHFSPGFLFTLCKDRNVINILLGEVPSFLFFPRCSSNLKLNEKKMSVGNRKSLIYITAYFVLESNGFCFKCSTFAGEFTKKQIDKVKLNWKPFFYRIQNFLF